VRCLYPEALNTTELLRQGDLVVSLEVFGGARGRTEFSGAVVLESKAEGVSLASNRVVLDSTEFQSPLVGELKRAWAPAESSKVAYKFSVDMPVLANEVELTLPNAVVGHASVPIPTLLLRHEKRLQLTGLCE
jgi:hypothetical protein